MVSDLWKFVLNISSSASRCASQLGRCIGTSAHSTLYDWQELAAGLLAVSAAVAVAVVVERRERGRLRRQTAAARAMLPLALSAAVDYAESSTSSLVALLLSATGERIPASAGIHFDPPPLDTGAISALRDMIENGGSLIQDRVARVLSEMQVLSARLRGLKNQLKSRSSIVVKENIYEYILTAATIFSRGSALFEYARRETDKAPPTYPSEKDLFTALNLMGFDVSSHDRLYERASKRAERWASQRFGTKFRRILNHVIAAAFQAIRSKQNGQH